MKPKEISKSVLKRLPGYLTYLKSLPEDGPANISATALAAALSMGEVQVRKDLALVSDGAGKLGRALLGYSGFAEYGLEIVAAFDTNEAIDGEMESGKPIYAISRLPQFCKERKVLMGIITVPAAAAQEVCDLLIANGIKAVWTFAPAHLDVPPHILVQYENMATSLAVLSVHLSAQINGK